MSKIEKITMALAKKGTISACEMHAIITSCKLHASLKRPTSKFGFEAYNTCKMLTDVDDAQVEPDTLIVDEALAGDLAAIRNIYEEVMK